MTAAAGTLLVVGGVGGVALINNSRDPGDPRGPFLGTWISTTAADTGTQTMTVSVSANGAIEIVVRDDIASVCSGTPSTMTGTGRLEGSTQLPAPAYTCDDGSEPQALSGPPLEEQLRDLTFVRDAETDTLTDNLGAVWERVGGEGPGPEPTTTAAMWPQSSLEEVQEAQEAADAGDPAYTWQVDPQLRSRQSDPLETDPELWAYLTSPGAAIVERFLREELGWEEFLFSGEATDRVVDADGLRGLVYLRCAPGEMNPLYPIAPDQNQEARSGERCAPTIDELVYEAVRLDLSQPDRRGLDGIWVVGRWTTTRFAQTDPSVVEAEATARLEDFLRARIEGEGADGYVEVFDLFGGSEDVPLLYATTTGAPYERSEVELVDGPDWPDGDMMLTVRLFAEGGETVVEQEIYVFFEGGRPTFKHNVSTTTENGQPLAEPGEEITVTPDLIQFGERLVGYVGRFAKEGSHTYVLPGQIDEVPEQGEYLENHSETAVLAAFDDAGVELWRTELDRKPNDVVVADGDAWVSREDGTVTRFDASDGRVLGHVTIEDMTALVGAFGSVWVTTQEPSGDGVGPGRLVRVDPDDLSTTSIEVRLFEGECHSGGDGDDGAWCPDANATAGAGAIWVPLKDDGVAMIDPETNQVTVIPVDDIGHEVLQVAVDGDVVYVASRSRVTSIVDGEVLATASTGEFLYLGPMDGVFGVLRCCPPTGQFQVLGANDPMVVEYRQVATEGQTGPVAEIDGEAWMEIGRNYDLRRVELMPTG